VVAVPVRSDGGLSSAAVFLGMPNPNGAKAGTCSTFMDSIVESMLWEISAIAAVTY
jgi:hypothetical protein